MNKRTEMILWISTGICLILAIIGWQAVNTHERGKLPSPVTDIPVLATFDAALLGDAADRSVAGNVFRINRRPSDVQFGTPDMPVMANPQPVPYSGIALKGVVGGPPWKAILSGVPAKPENVVVEVGDTLVGLRVQRIKSNQIVLTGKDSTFTLTLQRTWQ